MEKATPPIEAEKTMEENQRQSRAATSPASILTICIILVAIIGK